MPTDQIIVQLNPDVSPSGSDLAVCNAARRSFGKRSEWKSSETRYLDPKDKRLIEFLARGISAKDLDEFLKIVSEVGSDMQGGWIEDPDALKGLLWQWRNTPVHDTPFNHCHISFEVKAPIFVARQLVKTEYAPFSEFSRRYITGDIEFYIHDYREVAKDKKQGSGGEHEHNKNWKYDVAQHNDDALILYEEMIRDGVAPEQARGVLPVDLMTAWTWSATLGAFAKMCRERLGSDAQKETQYVAQQVYNHLKTYFPVSAKALVEGV